MTDRAKAWLTPGVIISIITLLLQLAGTWAIIDYRLGSAERRLDKMDSRLDRMERDGTEVIRLQERNQQLRESITGLRTDLTNQLESLKTAQEVDRMQAQKFREELYKKGVL